MHRRSNFQLLHVLTVLLLHIKPTPGFISGGEGKKFRCIDRERQALVKFKQELEDDFGALSSWGSEEEKSDCCKWRGVGCNNRTGHVTLLDLEVTSTPLEDDYKPLRGKISSSLLELQHLNYLDLSNNDFGGGPFPYFIGSLSRLRYLRLSYNNLIGTPSNQLQNLSRLQYLDLSHNSGVIFGSLDWLYNLSSLEHLDLSDIDLSQASDWLQFVNKLPNLKDLHLSACQLSNVIPSSLSYINSSQSLVVLDLSYNNLASSIFPWLSNFGNSLVDIDLSFNELQGSMPDAFGNMTSLGNLYLFSNQLEGGIPRSLGEKCSLRTLDLGGNKFIGHLSNKFIKNLYGCTENSLEILSLRENQLHGSLPDITRFTSMRELDLSNNQLNGTLPKRFRHPSKLVSLSLQSNRLKGSLTDVTMLTSLRELNIDDNQLDGNVSESIGSLSELERWYARGNSLRGVITEAHFSNLSKLQSLDLSDNSLALEFPSSWVPPFQLKGLHLRSCKMGPHFPKWLRTQTDVLELDISGAKISDSIPEWFWGLAPIYFLELSHNQLHGVLPDFSSKLPTLTAIHLSFNQFEGPMPLFPFNTISLDISNNMLSGPISVICKIAGGSLGFLDLSNNLFSGQLPNCFMHLESLIILNLANNNISGEIPSSMGSLSLLQTLSLHNNSFSGELPLSLKNCSGLYVLDLSGNWFHGEIPAWIGGSMSSLKFLSLQSNEFYGSIPPHLCQLTKIQILDLSLNNISGIIPNCLNNFSDMVQKRESESTITTGGYYYYGNIYVNKAWVEWKGRLYEYERNLGLLRIIDFACNRLTGEIPEEMVHLSELVALNLSGNNLTGVIPQKIGNLRQLESLDLSGNQLSGLIPSTMAALDFLNYLNLSYNNFSGKIPSSTQLQSFNSSAFTGNLALCGLPLTLKCPEDVSPQSPEANDDRQGNEENVDEFSKWFYTTMGISFGIFFWGVSGALLLKRSWRHAYFRLLDESWDWLCVRIAVSKARLVQKFQS